jgi:hypothetical protein
VKKRPGDTCRLTMDTGDDPWGLDEGDVLYSPTGRRYLILEARRSPSIRGRFYLSALVMAPEDDPPLGARAMHFSWHSRGKR